MTMYPHIPHSDPFKLLTQAQQSGRWGIVFQAITSVSLAVMTTRMLYDMVRGDDRSRDGRRGWDQPGKDLGQAVRREVERALAGHESDQQRRGR
jgi:hypothetical protein